MKKRKIISVIICILISVLILSSCSRPSDETQPAEDEEIEALVKTVDLGGKEMDYFRFGNQDGKKLVILPGLSLKSVMGSAEAVVAAYDLLAQDYDIYLFDHIREEPEGYSISQMADDTVSAFRQVGLDHVRLMGVSMGGMIAQTIAIQEPELVEGLVLCSTTSDVKDSDKTLFETWKKLAEEKDITALMTSFGENVYTPSVYEQFKDIIISSGDGADDCDLSNFIVSVNAIMDFDVYEKLDQIRCPVFVIGAGRDQVLGIKASEDIIEKLNCEYFIYEESGHGVYDEAPDYLEKVKGFLDSH